MAQLPNPDVHLRRSFSPRIVLASVGFVMACSCADSATLSLDRDGLRPSAGGDSGQEASEEAQAGMAKESVFPPLSCEARCPEELPTCLNDSCAQCSGDGQCEDDEFCELASGRCREPCTEAEECSFDEFCGAAGFCIECESDADCQLSDDLFCSPWGGCVECRSDADCDAQDGEICRPGVFDCDDPN